MKTIQLSGGYSVVVDDADFEWLSEWRWTHSKGYAIRHIRYGPRNRNKYHIINMHRLIMGLSADDPRSVDHINRNRYDNRRGNLRIVEHIQNCQNAGKRVFARGTSSRFKGVSWNKREGKWRARIVVNTREVHLGFYVLEEDAAEAYDVAAVRFFGEHAATNAALNLLRRTK